jgi:thiamine-phosphate pyrophosphorylase
LQNAPNEPVFCYVTDGSGFPSLERVHAAVAAGANWVQIREKQLGTRELLRLVGQVVQIAGQTNLRVVVNDRSDVALVAGAGGVHLGGRSIFTGEMTGWMARNGRSADLAIGVSCHSLADARAAESAGADYAMFGPVFRTPSKLGFGAPHGVGRLGEVCAAVKIAVLAIGGIDTENARDCFAAGAAGVAAIRMFQEARDPGELRRRLERARVAWRAR